LFSSIKIVSLLKFCRETLICSLAVNCGYSTNYTYIHNLGQDFGQMIAGTTGSPIESNR